MAATWKETQKYTLEVRFLQEDNEDGLIADDTYYSELAKLRIALDTLNSPKTREEDEDQSADPVSGDKEYGGE